MAFDISKASFPALLCLLMASQTSAADQRVLYAPDVVGVGRMFMVALKVPSDAPDVAVAMPEAVTMFDRTRLPAASEIRKFYFRSLKAAPKAEIRFAHPTGEIVVPVEIWPFEQLRGFRTLKGVQLPRRWPLAERLPELKQKQTFPTGAEAKKPKQKAMGGWLDYADDAIWAMQPDSTIPRWHWTNIQEGCPEHGKEVYRDRAYYPWHMDSTFPWRWKIRCPVGKEEYPSNDFAKGDMTSGAFPDDGIGGACLHKGHKYGFVAELCQFYCRRMMVVAPQCAAAYVATGDRQYAHKALVALCRLAEEYAYLATMTHHRHRNHVGQVERFGQGLFSEGPCLARSGFTTYPIEQPGQLISHAEAYDRIFPVIDRDAEIIPFLRQKGFDVNTHEEVRRFVEENLFAVWMQGLMDGALSTNEPGDQEALVRAALVLNYARGSDFTDWLYDGGGRMRVFVSNDYFRDGAPFESTGGYNAAHVVHLTPVVDCMEQLRGLRPDLYTEARYPALNLIRRYRQIFDFAMDTVTIDRSYPQIGDGGSFPAYQKLPKIAWHSADAAAFEHAYRLYRDPKFAWALIHAPGWSPPPDFPVAKAELEREAAKWPDDWNDRSSLHDGYGLAILRSGTGDRKRAFWLRYGRARSHTQDDLMDIGLQGFQGILLSHMGYPRNWGAWENSWTSHHVARQIPFQSISAQATLLAETEPVRVAEARAQGYADQAHKGLGYTLPPDQWQRRTIAMVDVDADRFYCVDAYRISGGTEHWWAFHGQEGEVTTEGIRLARQPGTLAGPDVPYGDPKWLKVNCSYGTYGWSGRLFGLAHLYNVDRGFSKGVWSVDWKLKSGEGLHLRLTVPSAEGCEVNLCDGTSPAGGNPYEMKWVMLRRQGAEPLAPQVAGILEPHHGKPSIRAVRPVKMSGTEEGGLAPAGCQVRLENRTDTILLSADAGQERTTDTGLRFSGRFGYWSVRDGEETGTGSEPTRAAGGSRPAGEMPVPASSPRRSGTPAAIVLVGGTTLADERFGLSVDSPEYRAKIVRVDRTTQTVFVRPAPPRPEALVGQYAFLANSYRRIAQQVLAAKPVADGAELRFGYDPCIGTGRVSGTADWEVKTSTPFTLQGFRYYHGARLVNAGGNAEYRILEVRSGSAAFIDREAHPDAKSPQLAEAFPRDTWFSVYDYGPGDELIWPYTVSLTLVRPGVYRLAAPLPVKTRLPEGCTLQEP